MCECQKKQPAYVPGVGTSGLGELNRPVISTSRGGLTLLELGSPDASGMRRVKVQVMRKHDRTDLACDGAWIGVVQGTKAMLGHTDTHKPLWNCYATTLIDLPNWFDPSKECTFYLFTDETDWTGRTLSQEEAIQAMKDREKSKYYIGKSRPVRLSDGSVYGIEDKMPDFGGGVSKLWDGAKGVALIAALGLIGYGLFSRPQINFAR